MENLIKKVGNRLPKTNPASCLLRAGKIIKEANILAQHPKPQGFVFKSRTWKDYETWKKEQSNPRL